MNVAGKWDHTKWGTYSDPIHKSDLSSIVGKFGCSEQFRRKKDERAANSRKPTNKAGGKLICGNAVHAVIARILRAPRACEAALHPDYQFPEASIKAAFEEEYERLRAGRVVEWYKVNADKWLREQVLLTQGALNDLHNHVAEVVLVEAGFIYQLDGIWLTGMTDIVYRPKSAPDTLALADWKTGAQKPHQIELDHGWESGIYSGAVDRAYFIPGENIMEVSGVEHRDSVEAACIELAGLWERLEAENGQETIPGVVSVGDAFKTVEGMYGARYFGEFPREIRHVHLRDYIPYSRKTSKMLNRPEELAWAGLSAPEKVSFEKGDTRGPGWLHINRSADDIPRLTFLLRNVVQWVRRGLFVPVPGEMCSRCKFKQPCLLDGYAPIGEEKAALEDALDGLGLDADALDGVSFDGEL